MEPGNIHFQQVSTDEVTAGLGIILEPLFLAKEGLRAGKGHDQICSLDKSFWAIRGYSLNEKKTTDNKTGNYSNK